MTNFPDFTFEQSLLPSGTRFLLGLDEVGRGPLAGPVTIGAFLLDLKTFSPDEFLKLKVRDSKKLSANQRNNIKNYFLANNFSFQTFSCTSQEIDQQGIAVCIASLFTKALKHYSSAFDFCLIDGNPIAQIERRSDNFFGALNACTSPHQKKLSRDKVQFVVKGDSQCFSIASASIIAKVDRDLVMDEFDQQFPLYGFKTHKGYGTKKHLEAINIHGPCKIHRLSFNPISQFSKS